MAAGEDVWLVVVCVASLSVCVFEHAKGVQALIVLKSNELPMLCAGCVVLHLCSTYTTTTTHTCGTSFRMTQCRPQLE